MSATPRSLRAALVIFTILCLIAPACRRASHDPTPVATPTVTTSPSTATPKPQATKTKPQKGGSVAAAVPEEPQSLNFTLDDSEAASWMLDAVEARMVRLLPGGSYDAQLLADVPTLDNGGISPDGLSWTLHFRPKLAWSDGEKLDARDFKFTWATIINPRYPALDRSGWSAIESVLVSADGLTAIVALRYPDAGFMDEVLTGSSSRSGGRLLPSHILENIPVDGIPDADFNTTDHVGSGPFKVAKWDPGVQVIVERNDHFAGPPAMLDRIVFRIVADSRAMLGGLGTGEIDLAPDVPESGLSILDQIPGIDTTSVPEAGAVDLLAFNLNDPANLSAPHPVLSDPVVRRAIRLAFNRARVASEIVPGQPPLVATPLAFTPWANASLTVAPFDPVAADRLLDDDGWRVQTDGVRARGGVRLSFHYTTAAGDDPLSTLRQQVQQAFIADMAAVGIEVVPDNLPQDQFQAALASRIFEAVDLWNDQRTTLQDFRARFTGSGITTGPGSADGNVMGYRSPAVDGAMAAASRAVDSRQRQQLIDQAQEQIDQDVPVITVFAHVEVDAARAYVQDLQPSPEGGLWWNVEAWWLDREKTTR